jgi:flagellar hook-associated protein 2
MATSNISGLGSGIDFGTIRDAILASRSRPIVQLQAKSSDYNNRIDALKQLNANLATLTGAAQTLTNRDLGSGKNAATGDASVVSASASNTAAIGNIDLSITRTATALSQASHSFATALDPVLAGGATSATFELRKGGATNGTSITIDSTNNSLTGLRDAINAANAGVNASIIDISGNGTQHQLVLSSADTGTAGRVELVETTSTGTLTDLNIRSLNPPDGDFSKLDAAFVINGLSLTRSSNTVSNAIEGVTFTLKKAGSTSISVTGSNEFENKVREFVFAYNAINDFVANQYKTDAKGKPSGVLVGDSTLRSVQTRLREAIGTTSTDNGSSLTNLTQVGLTIESDGKLKFDSSVFNEKLKSNSNDVRALFYGQTTNQTGIFQKVYETANSLSDSSTGAVQNSIQGYQNSIKNINDSINSRLEIINNLRDSLTKQFAAADAAIGQLNGQNSSLTNLLKTLQSNNK